MTARSASESAPTITSVFPGGNIGATESRKPSAIVANENQTVFDLNIGHLMSYFMYYETDAEGNPKEKPSKIDYSQSLMLLSLRYPGKTSDLLHYIDLACAAPEHPVDVTQWKDGQLSYSGRLVYHKGIGEQRRIILA